MDAMHVDMDATIVKLEQYLLSIAAHPQGALAGLDLILNLSIHVHLLGGPSTSSAGLLKLCSVAASVIDQMIVYHHSHQSEVGIIIHIPPTTHTPLTTRASPQAWRRAASLVLYFCVDKTQIVRYTPHEWVLSH